MGGFAQGAAALWVEVQVWKSVRGWEAKLVDCKKRMAKAVQSWRVWPEMVHFTEDGNKKSKSGCKRDQGENHGQQSSMRAAELS